MYTHPDPDVNDALVEALASPVRIVRDKIIFDFDNDGLFAHEYSDLSDVLIEADLERATLQSDLPDQVNSIQGFSSSELTLTFQGSRNSEEMNVARVLSPFEIGGPLFNIDIRGTTVRYSKIVETALGEVEIRQFTGVIRESQFSLKNRTVEMVCSDALTWINAPATLPHWAVDKWAVDNWRPGNARPINSAWVITELLRQANTPVGPAARSDAVWASTGMGSLLANVGSQLPMYNVLVPEYHCLPTNIDYLWQDGQYGPCLVDVRPFPTGEYPAFNRTATTRSIAIPHAGSADGPVNIGFNVWSESLGGSSRPHPSTVGLGVTYEDGSCMQMGFTMDMDLTNAVVNVSATGQVFVTLYQNITDDIYTWVFPTQTAGWHYYDVNFRFRSNSISLVLTVDGAPVSPTSGSNLAFGWDWTGAFGTRLPDYLPAPVTLLYFTPSQHFQIYVGGTGSVYTAGQEHPHVTKDGLPWVDMGGVLGELSWLEECQNRPVWEVLQEFAAAEFAGLYTNEWGQLVWAPHAALRQAEQNPTGAEYTVDDIIDQVMIPSLDQYKNEIVISYTDKFQIVDSPWEIEGWKQFPVPDNNIWKLFGPYPLENVISLANGFWGIPGWKDQKDSYLDDPFYTLRASSMARVVMDNLSLDGRDPNHDNNLSDALVMTGSRAVLSNDQRQVTFRFAVGVHPTYSGAYIGATPVEDSNVGGIPQEPGTYFNLRARMYGDEKIGYYTLSDTDEILDKGKYALILESAPWRQTFATAAAIAPELMEDTIEPTPIIKGLQLPSDPRIQLTDTVDLVPGDGVSGSIVAQIVGIRRGKRDAQDSYDVRVVRSVSTWILGTSVLGVNTVLAD